MSVRAQIPALLFLTLAIGLFSSCSRHADPDAVFDHAWQAFQDGDLLRAQEEASKGHDEFRSTSSDWDWKFTILEARILHSRGMYDEALKLLAAELAPAPQGELEIKKLWVQGLLHASLHNFPTAEMELAEAEKLCTGLDYVTCEDVATARGTLEMERGHYAAAQVFFASVLTRSRASHDQPGEASALLDLSYSADEQTHFDEALDWANAARGIATSQNLGSIAQKALGNMGWAYYKLGELERAESMFVEARSQAKKLGMVANPAGSLPWVTSKWTAAISRVASELLKTPLTRPKN